MAVMHGSEDIGRLYRWRWQATRWREKANCLQDEVEALRRTGCSMEHSLSWRLTAPLRWIDKMLRGNPGQTTARTDGASFAWAATLPVSRHEGLIIADCSMTARGLSSPGMQRVTRGLIEAASASCSGIRAVDFLSAPPRAVDGFLRGKTELGVPLDFVAGSTFVLLDASWHYLRGIRPLLARLQDAGVRVAALVCDTVPLDHPDLCSEAIVTGYTAWLDEVFDLADGVVCISESSAARVRHHLAARRPDRVKHIEVAAWYPGAEAWGPAAPHDEPIPQGDFLLCVGTVEPRKNQAFLLDAMEGLWRGGKTDCMLVIFGKTGWKTEDFTQRMLNHAEWGRRLWWFDGGSDAHVQQLYRACAAVALPSIDEGLSLPLSEAAAAGKPVVLSDIHVFRERVVSGGHFFRLGETLDLQSAILAATAPGAAPCVVPEIGWEASARKFVQLIRAMERKP